MRLWDDTDIYYKIEDYSEGLLFFIALQAGEAEKEDGKSFILEIYGDYSDVFESDSSINIIRGDYISFERMPKDYYYTDLAY